MSRARSTIHAGIWRDAEISERDLDNDQGTEGRLNNTVTFTSESR